ncbi:filamentous hemagglutinin N-terminal domain-containing protein [Xanthomonas sp. AmX2]|uniref:two-partner secretion domain-containing protein n=1 Tax=Xanthomonas sp. TaxID=29446 RepID=UPI00197F34B4|nr:filamentous hemagglutinin N-terminal domain-containing protein [Xanthomonas sp.]MBN6149140.1 filamentous hemagglutinin N-terminal domain-containing protein [Xanthomonas sp.]
MPAIAHASTAARAARTRTPRHSPLALALAATLAIMAPGAAPAQVANTQLPTGGSVVGGAGMINPPNNLDNTLTIDQSSSRMALTWSAFDIGSAATVTFNQPSSSAAVLNLVQGGEPTQIFGNLNANGQVFLINREGVIFGSTAQINVGGLVASTLGISASDFMSGNDTLDAGGTMVALMSNSGTINAAAGAVDLIGGKVVNSGTITASAGNINLVGADKVTLTFESGGFGVVVDKALQMQLDTLAVDNSGTLSAPGGIVTLQARAAQGLFDQLVNNSGIVTAAALGNGSDGSVSLIANGAGQLGIGGSGSIDVGSGAITIGTDSSVQQSGVYTAGTLGGSIGGDAGFTGNNRIAALGSLDVGGNLGLSNTIGLGQSGALTVAGSSSFALGSHALTLDAAGNDFGQAVSLSSGSATISDSGELILGTLATGNLTATSSGALNLGSGSVTGTLSATSNGGAIGQSASNSLTVTGTSILDAGSGSIALERPANDFGGAVSLTGSGIALADANALTIAALTLGSNSALSLSAGGALTLPGSAIDTGSADLSLAAHGAALSTAGDLRGRNVTLSARDGLTLGHDITTTGSGTLQLSSAAGAIQQAGGVLDVGGAAIVNAGGNPILLDRAGNEFRAGVSLTGTGITVVDQSDLVVSALSSGSNGAISLTAGGALTLPAQAIDTGTADLALQANGGALGITDALSGRNIALTGRDGVSLAGGVTSTGTLAVTSSGGSIRQDGGAIDAAGAATLTAAGAIELDAPGNDFRDTVSLAGTGIEVVARNDLNVASLTSGSNGALWLQAGGTLTLPTAAIGTGSGDLTLISGDGLNIVAALSGHNVRLTGGGGISLGADVDAGGTLALTSSDHDIVQSAGALTADGISTINAGTGAIGLANGNDFRSAVDLTGGDVTIADRNALTLGTLSTGTLTVASNGALNLGGGTVTGALDADSNGGAITQAAALTVGGSADIDAGSGDITLDKANAFQDTVGLTGTDAVLVNSGALTLAASTLGGRLDIDANGAIGQSGALRVTGASRFQAHGNAIGLAGPGNDFQGAVSLAGGGVQIAAAGDLELGTLATGALAATSHGALNLGSGTVGGALDARSNGGAITQSVATALTVNGTSTLDAGGGAIALANTGNDFGGAVDLTGNGIQLADRNDLDIAALRNGNDGRITLLADGSLRLPAGAIATGSGDLSLVARNGALHLGGALSGRNLTLGSGSALILTSDVAATGDLLLTTANATLGQANAALTVGGATTVATGSGAIALTDAGNHFAGTVDIAGGAVQLRGSGALTLGNLSVDSLDVTSGGILGLGQGRVRGALQADSGNAAIGQSGALRVDGDAALVAGSGAITLDQANRFAGTLSLTGGDTRIRAVDGLSLGTSNVAALQLSSGGALRQLDALTVTGDAAIDAGSGAIALDAAGNDFQGTVALAGGSARIRDANALALGTLAVDALDVANRGALTLGAGSVAGNLVADSGGGAVTQRGALRVDGSATINSGAAAIALDDAGNDFQGEVNLAGGAAHVRDRNALALGSVAVAALTATSNGALSLGQGSIGGDLVARSDGAAAAASGLATASAATPAASGGDIGQRGALSVAGSATLDAGSGAIALTEAGNDFQGTVLARGGAIAIADRNDLAVAAQAGGALALSAGGALRTAGASSGSGIALGAGGDLELGHDVTSSGALQLRSGGAITQTGGVLSAASLSGSAGGATRLDGANAIAALGEFGATQLSLRTLGDLTVAGPVTVGDALRLSAGGDLAIDGALGASSVWLQAGGDLGQGGGGRISAATLSGSVGGSTRLGGRDAFVDNRIGTLGNFASPGGFSLSNGQSLTLSALDGSAYTVNAGTSALYLGVLGDLLQADTTWLYDGAGVFSASGRIGTAANPIYVRGVHNQTVAAIGLPPAYFYALRADGALLGVDGESGINVPTSAFASRAQSSSNRTVAYVDLGAANAPYRAFGLVKPGIRLPADQQPACDPDDPDAQCEQE